MARGELDERLLPTAPLPRAQAEPLRLPRHPRDRDPLDLDVEQQLHRLADVGLVRVRAHAKDDLARALREGGGLLGDVRTDDHLHQPLLPCCLAHAKRSSSDFAAAFVTTTAGAPTRDSGSTLRASTTSSCGRLRAASHRFTSKSATTMRPRSMPSSASFFFSSFVFGAATPISSATTSRSCRRSSDSIDRIAARYILRLTFWS